MSFVLGGQEGSYQICYDFPVKERAKSTAAELFSFPTDCEGRSSDLARWTFFDVPLQASDHEFVGNSLSLWVFCPIVHGCLGASKEKRCSWIY